ncbi:hypothetical protein CH63R_06907 [Colletotrichum higginsianum IMI 349063]|uniref:F-box domain-containing protein n=1 Tax=Colletotrichum higginsianum (strain IMI 349063) TaxID=759273 RepID=A0A1B7YGT2_COLHI|nr:hypothetical protein CH63R_06907 [Colletotrichum higginsianum IMI 349063]OBR11215.1 hypothetical protein CH63R_06907 [Colletotrichum higginsianum IMI 349063]
MTQQRLFREVATTQKLRMNTSTMEMNKQTQKDYFPKFFELPAELRNRIYELSELIPTEYDLDAFGPAADMAWSRTHPQSSLTLVSRQVRGEVLSLLHSKNHFHFWLGSQSQNTNRSAASSNPTAFIEVHIDPSHAFVLKNIKSLYLHFFCGIGPGVTLSQQLVRSALNIKKLTICPNSRSDAPASNEFQAALELFLHDIQQIRSLQTVRLADPIPREFTQPLALSKLFVFRLESICSGLSHRGCDHNTARSPESYAGQVPTEGNVRNSIALHQNIQQFLWTAVRPARRWHMSFFLPGMR